MTNINATTAHATSLMANILCIVDFDRLWKAVTDLDAENASAILASVRRLQVDPTSAQSGLCSPEARQPNSLVLEVFPITQHPSAD